MNPARQNPFDGLSRDIGVLQEGVRNLVKKVDQESSMASVHREGLREIMGALTEAVRVLTSKVEVMQPLVDDYREKRAMLLGITGFGKFVFAVWLSAAGVIGGLVSWAMHNWFKP